MKFKVTYPDGQVEEVSSSDANSAEELANVIFGSTWNQAQEDGAAIEALSENGEETSKVTKKSKK